jgi:hypothetical protein
VDRVRRRARAVQLAGAVVAALAADVWYEACSFWLFRLFKFRIWNPLFFFVALAVFSAFVVQRTRTFALNGLLDARFALKQRLVSAFRFARLARVPAELREAQARETLRAVDFGRLRASFRFRPWGPLAFLAVGSAIVAALMYRYPESFNPRNLAFRQGRVVFMAVKNIGTGGGDGAGAPGAGDGQQGDGTGHPIVALVSEGKSPKQKPAADAQPGGTADEKPPPGGEQSPTPESGEGTSPHPEKGSDGKPPPGDGQGSRPGPNEGGALGRAASLEETDGISPPTSRPESGLAAGAADLRGPGTGPSLPPLPFVRLLGGDPQAGALFDPETLNIVLEAYPPKYREHLESYLKALQTLMEGRKGS